VRHWGIRRRDSHDGGVGPIGTRKLAALRALRGRDQGRGAGRRPCCATWPKASRQCRHVRQVHQLQPHTKRQPSRGLASLTVRLRPSSWLRERTAMAASPPSLISTNENPRGRPVSRSHDELHLGHGCRCARNNPRSWVSVVEHKTCCRRYRFFAITEPREWRSGVTAGNRQRSRAADFNPPPR